MFVYIKMLCIVLSTLLYIFIRYLDHQPHWIDFMNQDIENFRFRRLRLPNFAASLKIA